MNEDKIKGIKAIVSYYNKVELLKEEIDKLKSIRESNTFIMTIFLAGENSVDNYTMSITSDNMMQNDYGVLYQDFIDKLIEGKEKELASYNMVLEKVKAILSEQFDVEEDSITPDTNLSEDLEADSLDVVDLLMSIEDEFEIEVPDEEIENIKTVDQLVKYIEANMK